MPCPHTPLVQQVQQRLFALWAARGRARLNGDPVSDAKVLADGTAILRELIDAAIRAHDHKNSLSAPRHDYPRDDPFDPPDEE